MLKPCPHVLGGKALRRVKWGHEGRTLMRGMGALVRVTRKLASSLRSTTWGCNEEPAVCTPTRPSPGFGHPAPGSQPSSSRATTYEEIVPVVPRPPVYVLCALSCFVFQVVEGNTFSRFYPSPTPTPSLRQPSACSLYLWVCFCFVWSIHLVLLLDSTYKQHYMGFVSLFLASFT